MATLPSLTPASHFRIAHRDQFDTTRPVTTCYLAKLLFLGWRRSGGFGVSPLFHQCHETSFPTLTGVNEFVRTRRIKGKAWEIKDLPIIVVESDANRPVVFGGFESFIFEKPLVLPVKNTLGGLWNAIINSNSKGIHVLRTAHRLPPAPLPLQWLKRVPAKPTLWKPTSMTVEAADAIQRVCEVNLWLDR